MKYLSAVFLGLAIIQTIPVESGSLDAFGSSASAATSSFWNGQGSNQVYPTGVPSASAAGRKNDISIDVDILQKKQQQQGSQNIFNGFNMHNAGNMNEHEMHHHISQYFKNMNGGSNIPSTSGTKPHGFSNVMATGNNKNDISIDLDISTKQQGQGYPVSPPAAGDVLSNALGSVGSAASSLKNSLFGGSKPTKDRSSSNEGDKKISLDIDLDTDGDGRADHKINVDIDQKSDEKDLGHERGNLKSGNDLHMGENGKGPKKDKKNKKQNIKKQKNKHVSNMSWQTTTNHYHPGQLPPPPNVVQIHFPPTPMPMHQYVDTNVHAFNRVPRVPATITHNSMNAAASSLSLQSTTVPAAYNSHAPPMTRYGHPAVYGQSHAASTMSGMPNGYYGHADAAATSGMQSGIPPHHMASAPFNQMNQAMHGAQNLYAAQAPSGHYQSQMQQMPQMSNQYAQPQQYGQPQYGQPQHYGHH